MAGNGSVVRVHDLAKTFAVPDREAGLRNAAKSLFRRTYRSVEAVAGITFDVAPGEIVGFVGPNGAGKTTTLKMLAGLLHPSSGSVDALGFDPRRRDHDYLRRISMIMGNRRQLAWDVPAVDSFEVRRAVYQISAADFARASRELIELFDVGDLITKPVRTLSLGERMKVEIVGSLLHEPELLFLDEPTIGLDVPTQATLRSFIAEYRRTRGASVLLTSHYMADIEALADRVVVIAAGRLLYDGSLAGLGDRVEGTRTLAVTLAEPADLSRYGTVSSVAGPKVTLLVPRDRTAATTARLLAEQSVTDLTVTDPPIEQIISQLFESGKM